MDLSQTRPSDNIQDDRDSWITAFMQADNPVERAIGAGASQLDMFQQNMKASVQRMLDHISDHYDSQPQFVDFSHVEDFMRLQNRSRLYRPDYDQKTIDHAPVGYGPKPKDSPPIVTQNILALPIQRILEIIR